MFKYFYTDRLSLCSFILFFFLLFSSLQSYAQENEGSISGYVVDSNTKKPMEFVNVFIANTMKGSSTDKNGFFEIKGIAQGMQEIVASFVGYTPYRQQVKISTTPYTLNIQIQAQVTELKGVEITGEVDKTWKKQMRKFKSFFLGNTSNKEDCIIVNEEVLDFQEDEKTKTFTAKARDLLIIENRALGYKITYLLENFEVDKDNTSRYLGKPKFDFLEPKNDKEKKRWEYARVAAYKGSLRHFLHAAATDSLTHQGFEVYTSLVIGKDEKKVTNFKDLMLFGETSTQRLLKFNHYLKIIYNGRTERFVRNQAMMQTCWIKMTQSTPAMFYTNGHLNNPLTLFLNGYWATLGMADELPYEYNPPKIE